MIAVCVSELVVSVMIKQINLLVFDWIEKISNSSLSDSKSVQMETGDTGES